MEEQEETEFQKKIKRIITIAIALFLIFLMLAWLIPTDVASSLLASKKINNFEIKTNNLTIYFEPNVYENLKVYYMNNQLTEFKLCLKGNIENNVYRITSFYAPKTLFATPISIESYICDEETIIDLHSHPFRNCLFSDQDIISSKQFKKINPNSLSAIMCDINRFSFIS